MTIGTIFFYSLIPFAALVAGGLAAVIRPPGPAATAMIQHFAAGVIFCAVAAELLPPIRAQSPVATVIGFAGGIATVLGIRQLGRKLEKSGTLGSAEC